MLKVYSNKQSTQFVIGDVTTKDFNMVSDELLLNSLFKLDDEIKLLEIQEEFGATAIFYDNRNDKLVNKEAYIAHFKNYNSDECYILSTSIFPSLELAEKCLKYLEDNFQ